MVALLRPSNRPATYPSRFVFTWMGSGGAYLRVRPITYNDLPKLMTFHQRLSDESARNAMFGSSALESRSDPRVLAEFCRPDLAHEAVLVVTSDEGESHREMIIAVGRLVDIQNSDASELTLAVNDAWQNMGIGKRLTRCLLYLARRKGRGRVIVRYLVDNAPMRWLCRGLGFTRESECNGAVEAEFPLD